MQDHSSSFSLSAATRQRLRTALSLAAVLGIVLALWPAGQSAYARWSQHQLMTEWQNTPATSQKSTPPATKKTAKKSATSPKQAAAKKAVDASAVEIAAPQMIAPTPGDWPRTRIISPDIDLDAVVIQRTAESDLARGPIHYPQTALPGRQGNCVIAGHRNVAGSWFYKIESLMPGSIIRLQTREESFDYQVLQIGQVSELDTSVLQSNPNGPAMLTLITCTLPHSPYRVIVSCQSVS